MEGTILPFTTTTGDARLRRTNSSSFQERQNNYTEADHNVSPFSPQTTSRRGIKTNKLYHHHPRTARRRPSWRRNHCWRWTQRWIRRNDRFVPLYCTVLLSVLSLSAFLYYAASTVFGALVWRSTTTTTRQQQQQRVPTVSTDFSVVLAAKRTVQQQSNHQRTPQILFATPETLGLAKLRHGGHEDYGGLELDWWETKNGARRRHRKEPTVARTVMPVDPVAARGYHELNPSSEQVDDDVDEAVYAFDDDVKRNPYNDYEDDQIASEKHCRRTRGYRDLPINCNNLHEFDVQSRFLSGDTQYLGEGAFREVYLSRMPRETLIFKAYVWDSDFEYEDFEWMRFDAIVAEKLSSRWSDKIVGIYGFCGTAMINEAMENGDIEKIASPLGHRHTYKVPPEEEGQLIVKNELTGTQKLVYGLEMAEAVAVLHSYSGGVIVHNDIKLAQFLWTKDGHIKLNDFNRAEIMLFNEKDQEYCPYVTGIGGGVWRAPEEYAPRPLDEKIDVWSIGNNLYALLTGLKPHYHIADQEKFEKALEHGETAFIDPRFRDRSFAEGKLVDIIPLCWAYDPDERIEIFELVRLLREAIKENELHIKSAPEKERQF